MNKHIIYLLLLIITTSFGMNQYGDQNIRKELSLTTDADRIVQLGAGKIIKKNIPHNQRYGQCHNYAISTLMGIPGKVPEIFKNITGLSYSYYEKDQINILEHFNRVNIPQAGDIALYISTQQFTDPNQIEHTGIVIKDGNIKSKWGIIPAILKHPVWYVPEYYGNYIVFFRPNKTGSELLHAVQEKLKNPQLQQKNNQLACKYQQHLFNLASNNYPISHLNKNTFTEAIDDMLQTCMNIDPNKPDEKGRTTLMFAAQAGDIATVNLLISNYMVEVDKQDEEGNTALMYAAINGYDTIKNILIDNGANPDIKNDDGITAEYLSEIYFTEACTEACMEKASLY